MNRNSKLYIAWLVAVAALIFIGCSVYQKVQQEHKLQGTVNFISDRFYEDAIGTSSTPATLSYTYASNTSAVLKIPGLSNVVVAGTYLPKSHGSTLYLQFERSIDNGTNYFPIDVITPSADRVSVYSNSFVTSSSGVPFQVPGSGSSASGTAINFSFDNTWAADYIRVSAKESTTSTAGTLLLQLLTTNH